MEKIFDLLLTSFDFGYMITVNILTYLIIKLIDQLNGPDKEVPVWLKRVVAAVSGLILGVVLYIQDLYSNIILYSFIASFVSWDTIFKPIIKRFKQLDYNHDESN